MFEALGGLDGVPVGVKEAVLDGAAGVLCGVPVLDGAAGVREALDVGSGVEVWAETKATEQTTRTRTKRLWRAVIFLVRGLVGNETLSLHQKKKRT